MHRISFQCRWLLGVWLGSAACADAQPFQLPTANRFLFEKDGEARFFAPTVGKTWISGTFGCVRTEGYQLHEGIDILHLQTDRRGEPTDPVLAVADGEVVYLNTRTGLSNYGRYLVVRHRIDQVTVYSLYAHLSAIQTGLQPGSEVRSGETIATLGRSTNTKSGIGKDRAHLHLEIDFQLHPRYAQWHARYKPDERNDHGNWNGRNLLGIDPWRLYLEQRRLGTKFRLAAWIRSQPEVARVYVPFSKFPWLQANPGFIRPNSRAQKEGVAGYELALSHLGLPFECTPRAASELTHPGRQQVLYVNPAEVAEHRCRKLVLQRGNKWDLTPAGQSLISLVTAP